MDFISLIIFVITSASCILLLIFLYEIVYPDNINWKRLRYFQNYPFLLTWIFLFYLQKNNYDCLSTGSLMLKITQKGFLSFSILFKKLIVIFNPDYVKEILTDEDNIDRPLVHYGLKNTIEDSFPFRNGLKWKLRKQQLIPLFSQNNLNSLAHDTIKYSRNLLQQINNQSHGEWIDISPFLGKYLYEIAFDFIWEYPETSILSSYSYVSSILNFIENLFIERAFNIFLWSDTIFYITSKGKKMKKHIYLIKKLTEKVINNTIKNGFADKTKYEKAPGVLLRCLLEKKFDFTLKNLIDEVIILIVGAHHTMRITLSWTLYEIGKNPDIQKNIQNELNGIFGNDMDSEITMEDLKNMQYLECVIKETLRLYPPILYTGRTPKVSHTFGNEVFPVNTNYIIPIFHIQRSPSLFPNPELFQPERFLPENSSSRHPFSFLAFSSGPRQCPDFRLNKKNGRYHIF